MTSPRLTLGAALCAVVLLVSAARAADEAMVLRMSAQRLAAENRCDEAIEHARRARALAPDDAVAPAIEGRCLLDQKRYAEAVTALEASRQLDPNDPETAVELLMAHYHGGDRAAAERALADAKRLAPDDARVSLYEGLVLMQRAENRAAAEALERAGRLDPAADPYASYYAGLAWQQEQERERAREALQRARERAAGGPWAAEADRALANLDAAGAAPRFWLRAEGGMEYDDNVVLRADGTPEPNDISHDDDARGVWSLLAGTEFFRTRDWASGLIVGYQGSAHFDLHDFDLQYPSGSIYVDRRVDDASFVRVSPYGGYAWTGGSDYLAHVGGEFSYYRGYREAGSGRLWSRVGYQDYVFPQHDDSEQTVRDGMQYLGGYDHALPVTGTTTLRAGMVGGAYVAQGRDYDSYTIGGNLGAHQVLPWRFELDVSGGFAYEPYEHESSFNPAQIPPPPFRGDHTDRIDKIWTAAAELERPITPWLSASARYRYINNDSNTRVFDYDRHIVGGYLTVLWTY